MILTLILFALYNIDGNVCVCGFFLLLVFLVLHCKHWNGVFWGDFWGQLDIIVVIVVGWL